MNPFVPTNQGTLSSPVDLWIRDFREKGGSESDILDALVNSLSAIEERSYSEGREDTERSHEFQVESASERAFEKGKEYAEEKAEKKEESLKETIALLKKERSAS